MCTTVSTKRYLHELPAKPSYTWAVPGVTWAGKDKAFDWGLVTHLGVEQILKICSYKVSVTRLFNCRARICKELTNLTSRINSAAQKHAAFRPEDGGDWFCRYEVSYAYTLPSLLCPYRPRFKKDTDARKSGCLAIFVTSSWEMSKI